MNVLEVIKNRRSVRRFEPTSLRQEVVDKLIEALRWAPSAGNLQSRKFFFVTNEGTKAKLMLSTRQTFLDEAPLLVVACADLERVSRWYGRRGVELYAVCDVACSIQNMMLVAQDLGLGTVWVGTFEEAAVARILNLSRGLRPMAIVPVGFPAEEPSAPPRVSPDEVAEFV